jgi:hypothetical protein
MDRQGQSDISGARMTHFDDFEQFFRSVYTPDEEFVE